MRPVLTALVAIVVLSTATTVGAETTKIAVVNIEISGDGAPELAAQLASSVAAGLRAHKKQVVPLGKVRTSLSSTPELLGCSSSQCLARIGKRLSVAEFVRLKVGVAGANYTTRLELHNRDGLVRKLERSCNVCTIAELNALVKESSSELLSATASTLNVVIATSPPGARISVDGDDVGISPVELELTAGDHQVTASKAGYTQSSDTFAVTPDDEEPRLDMILSPTGARPVPTTRSGRWKWIAAGGAVATLATGITLIAIDGDETCASTDTRCTEVRDTQTAGLISLGAAAVLAGVSTWLFVRDRRRPNRELAVVPSASGWSAVFVARF